VQVSPVDSQSFFGTSFFTAADFNADEALEDESAPR
jgi:hypothetical protein